MRLYTNCGQIEAIVGCMQSGKSPELARRIRHAAAAGQQVALFTPRLAHSAVLTRGIELTNETTLRAIPVDRAEDIPALVPAGTTVVAIDEVQFLDDALVPVVSRLASVDGYRVICSGLDTDFRGETFGPVGNLLAQAEVVTKMNALCVLCGATATRTQRLVSGRPVAAAAPTIQTTDDARYQPRCRACHMVPEATR